MNTTSLADTARAVAGDLVPVPSAAHTLSAVEDSALLLTVSLVLARSGPAPTATLAGPAYSWQEDWEQA